MRTVYLDSEFKCHVTDDGTLTAVETDGFDGKCDTFIEGYRFIPAGETWIRPDGVVFTGEMVSPHMDYAELRAAQKQYDAAMEEMAEAYQEGVNSI